MPRASPHRVRPANPALLARPGALLASTQAGPASSSSRSGHSTAELALTPPPLTLHELHASGCSSAPVPEPAPATSRACAPFPLSLLPSRRLGSHSAEPPGTRRPCPAASARSPREATASPTLGSRLPLRTRGRADRLRPLRGPAHSWRGLSCPPLPPHPAGHRALGPLLPARLALLSRALRGKRAPGPRALRAPASPGSCQCGDCAGKHGDRGNDPHEPRPSNPCRGPHR